MVIRVVATTLAAIGLAACSFYGGLDGFSSSGDPPTSPDGATNETGGSSGGDGAPTSPMADAATDGDADAGADTGTPPVNDAGADARYCTAFASNDYCTDFDEPSNPLAMWAKNTTSTADITLATSGTLSAPNALRATAGASGTNRYAYFTRDVGTAVVDRARLSYALYVEQRPTGHEIEANGLVFSSTNNSEFYLAIVPNGTTYIVEQIADFNGNGVTANYHDLGSAVPTGQWVRVTLDVTLSGTKELVLSIDGTERARKALTLTGPGVPRVRAGITWCDKAATNGAVLVDDLRFDILP